MNEWEMCIDEWAKRVQELKAQLQARDATIAKLKTMSTAEIMCENISVKHHVEEWEARCLKAEATIARLEGALATLRTAQQGMREALKKIVGMEQTNLQEQPKSGDALKMLTAPIRLF